MQAMRRARPLSRQEPGRGPPAVGRRALAGPGGVARRATRPAGRRRETLAARAAERPGRDAADRRVAADGGPLDPGAGIEPPRPRPAARVAPRRTAPLAGELGGAATFALGTPAAEEAMGGRRAVGPPPDRRRHPAGQASTSWATGVVSETLKPEKPNSQGNKLGSGGGGGQGDHGNQDAPGGVRAAEELKLLNSSSRKSIFAPGSSTTRPAPPGRSRPPNRRSFRLGPGTRPARQTWSSE